MPATNRILRCFLVLGLLLLSGISQAQNTSTKQIKTITLKQLWKSSRATHFQAPTRNELHQAEQLFQRHFQGEWSTELQRAWQSLGFDAQIINTHPDQSLLVIKEQTHQRQGRGFFVFNTQSQASTVLQAPHSFKDSYTGAIAIKWFTEGDYRAGAWNTIPRNSIDVAHASESYFNAFSRALGRTMPQTRLIQVHGFAQQKRRSHAGQTADLILSSASKRPTPQLLAIAACARKLRPNSVRIYPLDVNELGGTRNVNAAVMRQTGQHDFIHTEMSKPLRQKLLKDQVLSSRLSGCMTEGMQ